MPAADLDLLYSPATELAARIRAKTLSPVELVENALARIEQVNPALNAFCFTYPDEARTAAQRAEAAVMTGEPLGPLHGLPIAIKDLTPTKGKTTTLGSKVFEHWVPEHDAPIVERLLAAGAILVGKTTTPEFAHSGFTQSPLWGISRNPWNPERTPGGSSGGSAAAVTSGCVALAEGSDAGGSVRIPAAMCGCVGLKPSLGRIPLAILPTAFEQYCHFGPLARTIDDAALFLSVTEGPDERDILSLPRRPTGEATPAPPVPGDVAGLKIALSPDLGFFAVDDDVAANLTASADALRAAGAEVEEIALPWDRSLVDCFVTHWGVLMALCFGEHLDAWREQMDPAVVSLIEKGNRTGAVELRQTEIVRTRQWESLRGVFERFDALLCPTVRLPAPSVELTDRDFNKTDEAGRFLGMVMTMPFNLLGPCPALSVPSGFSRDGLPTAAQIVGRRYDEASVLRIGAALERARPWAGQRPPL
jgi:Asp-tRNA(Asn)/Glu-tRNA(Gln) amidotransferase A subunit family amidase